MPTENQCTFGENNDKIKLKVKVPRRGRRKKQIDANIQNNNAPNKTATAVHKSPEKQIDVPPDIPLLPTISPTTTVNSTVLEPVDFTSISYWKQCTKKALDILEKQASNRRKLLIEKHQERVHSIQCLLNQREQIDLLTKQNHTISESLDSFRNAVNTKDETINNLQEKLHNLEDVVRNSESLRIQLQASEQRLQRFTIEYAKKMEENRKRENDYNEQVQGLLGEIERIKRDLVLEEYRKQEAERKVRYYDEKLKKEQNSNKKVQQDVIQLKQDLKSIQTKYDALQIEMLAMHKANNNDISLTATTDILDSEWSKKRTLNDDADEHGDTKRLKRKTQDLNESSSIVTRVSGNKKHFTAAGSSKNKENEINDTSSIIKRKTSRSKKSSKNYLPILTLTEVSPLNSQNIENENDSSEILLPQSISATTECNTLRIIASQDMNCESQIIKSRTTKRSRYPCRRAQRPVKLNDTNDQVKN